MALTLATFNVLDLFDAKDASRIERIAALLRPHSPDIVALQEVGGEEPVSALGVALGPGFSHVLGDADERGIRCALLTRLPVVSSNVLRAPHLPYPRFRREDPEPFGARIPLRRPIPDVVVETELGRVRVLVVHFKSRRGTAMRDESGAILEPRTTAEVAAGEARAVAWRCAEALFVRGVLDGYLGRDRGERIVVCGDFNDVAGSLTLRVVAGLAGAVEPRGDALTSCAERIPLSERVSVLHGGVAGAIDHALLSSALASKLDRCFYERTGLVDVETPGAVYASDHAPLIVRFTR
jgi:endonuclease/exonuclease/phosphatase family metal-dependent hydrolase